MAAGWRRERPGLDVHDMEAAARIHRASAPLRRRAERAVQSVGLKLGEFDVLSALRRAGQPYRLTAGALADSLMMSPGGLTNRLDRLENAKLIRRRPGTDDKRSRDITLTTRGKRTVDAAADAHVASLAEAFAAFSDQDRRHLERLLGLTA